MKVSSEILAVVKELTAGNRQTIAIFPGENPKYPYMFWYLENGTVWYTSGGNSKVNEGTLEEFIEKVQAGRSRARFVENGQIVSHPPKIIVASKEEEFAKPGKSPSGQSAWFYNGKWYPRTKFPSGTHTTDGKVLDMMTGKVASERKMTALGEQYTSIQDAVAVTGDVGYSTGTTEIWYANDAFIREAGMGYEWLEKKGILPDPSHYTKLELTHVFLGRIKESNLNKVMRMMQGQFWSPEGEARSLIRRKGLGHTSMSVGDIIRANGKTLLVDRVGFKELTSREVTAAYPDSAPNEQEKKEWREEAEKRRRKDGIKERKIAEQVKIAEEVLETVGPEKHLKKADLQGFNLLEDMRQAEKLVMDTRFAVLTGEVPMSVLRDLQRKAKQIANQFKTLADSCLIEMREPLEKAASEKR